mmetsp:Transcript_17295/g.54029  ORF Transcript_17295/g.54029 Transcript_17295/m.54029 type:complete len:225 (+) Transcript_17295:385-1059(+)
MSSGVTVAWLSCLSLSATWSERARLSLSLAARTRSATVHCLSLGSASNLVFKVPSRAAWTAASTRSSTCPLTVEGSWSASSPTSSAVRSAGSSVEPSSRHCMTASSDVTSKRARADKKQTTCSTASGCESSGRASYRIFHLSTSQHSSPSRSSCRSASFSRTSARNHTVELSSFSSSYTSQSTSMCEPGEHCCSPRGGSLPCFSARSRRLCASIISSIPDAAFR